MSKIIFDTAVGSTNLGDHIIMDSVTREAEEIFKDDFLVQVATHWHIHPLDLPLIRKGNLALVGGTNLLKNNMLFKRQWKVGLKEIWALKNKVVLCGVGWWQYQQNNPDVYSQFIYKNLLSNTLYHAVRDRYTLEKLNRFGIKNVINTGCPTVWSLTPEHCLNISTEKSEVAITTVTDYMKSPSEDKQMLETLAKSYKEVWAWPQGSKDIQYLKSLKVPVKLLPSKLSSFDSFLQNNDCDYVGTRLHAGIRALQFKRRALIIGIDNRAKEMHKDINLPVLPREEISSLGTIIEGNAFAVNLKVDFQSVDFWKNQFKRS